MCVFGRTRDSFLSNFFELLTYNQTKRTDECEDLDSIEHILGKTFEDTSVCACVRVRVRTRVCACTSSHCAHSFCVYRNVTVCEYVSYSLFNRCSCYFVSVQRDNSMHLLTQYRPNCSDHSFIKSTFSLPVLIRFVSTFTWLSDRRQP